MSGVDAESRILSIGEEIGIKIDRSDVTHVFGIPCNGKAVVDTRYCSRDSKDQVLDKYLGSKFREKRSIKLVQEIIEREYPDPMSESEVDTFKVAFTVFVVSTLLAPSAKHDYASIDYWNAISDPGSIQSFDWSEFVVVKLVDGVSKLKEDLASNIKFPVITGCCLFLQVMYMDNLQLDGHVMRHNIFPRIRDFSSEKMKVMILDDRNFLRYLRSCDDIPPCKLRDPVGCVYSWAVRKLGLQYEPRGAALLAVWETAVAMVNLLDIPFEAAGPVFVAAADFQDQVNSGLFVNGTLALKFMSVLMSIMMPYRRGFRYNGSYSSESGSRILEDAICNGVNLLSEPTCFNSRITCAAPCGQCQNSANCVSVRPSSCDLQRSEVSAVEDVSCGLKSNVIGDAVQRSWNSLPTSLDDMPYHLNVNERVASAMSDFYSLISRLKPAREFDLNISSKESNSVMCSSSGCSSSRSVVLPSPWEIGYRWLDGDPDLNNLVLELGHLQEFEGMVIVHRHPKYIQISGVELYGQVAGNCEMETDLFDALVRKAQQDDDMLYSAFGDQRWRHIFESDFMASILSGAIGINDCLVRERLCALNLGHDLTKCKILFFPALLHCSWVSFSWLPKKNMMYVFEPSQSHPVVESRVSLIERCCYLFKMAMHSVARLLFPHLRHHPHNAAVRLLTLDDIGTGRLNRTGVLCYMFCCCFNGSHLVPSYNESVNAALPSKILWSGLRLQGNDGKFLDTLAHASQ